MAHSFHQNLQRAIRCQIPFAIYRFPGGQTVNLIIKEEKGEESFIMHSFDSKKEEVISSNQVFSIPVEDFNFDDSIELISANEQDFIQRKAYENRINNTIKTLKEGAIKKIVISRIKKYNNNDYNVLKSLHQLILQHKDALVYLWHNPGKATWMGATPELLLSRQANQINTVALAGTKRPEAEWTKKEILEQAYVTDFILDNLKDLKEVVYQGPETITAGRFNHLKTYIQGRLTSKTSVKELLEKIHPTPAVCGLPKKASYDYIIDHEKYDRDFYTGYIGIKSNEKEDYFVNLRCCQWFRNQIWLYVGGGILADSVATKEWEETELKSGTIVNALIK